MSNKLSRREMVMLSGASVLAPSAARVSDACKSQISGRQWGHDLPWGENPHGAPKYSNGASAPVYKPGYIAVAVIDFKEAWTIDVHHASFKINPSSTPYDRLRHALESVGWILLNNKKLGDLKNHTDASKRPYERRHGQHAGKHHISSLEEFKFKSQNEIFIFLRSPHILLDPNWLVAFTLFSETHQEMKQNYSFFNAHHLEGAALGSLRNEGKLIRIENYATNPDGTPTVAHLDYAMNIHFKMRAKSEGGEQNYVPMVIDPETGNGAGHEP